MNKSVSPSRTYVAVCSKMNFNGYYFKKFHLPERCEDFFLSGRVIRSLDNNSDTASWYFLNHLNCEACIDGVISWEDYSNIQDEVEATESDRDRLLRFHKERIEQFTEQAVESMLQYVGRESHEPGCDGNFNGGMSCSCSPNNEEK